MAQLRRGESRWTATQGVAGAAVLISGSLVISRVLGLVRVSVFAALFGTSPAMAAYNAAFRIPDLLFTLVAGGALSSAFVPVFAGLLERRQETEAWKVASTVLNSLFVLLLALALIGFAFAPEVTKLLVPGFDASEQTQAAFLTRIMLVQPVLLGVGGLFAAMQNSYQRFILPAVAPVVYNASIIVGAVVFGPRFGVSAAAWAVVVGAVIMFEIQIWGVVRESRWYQAAIHWSLPESKEILRLLGPRLIGLSSFQFMLLVTTFLASSLTSAGFNAITYSWTLVMFPVGAVGSAVGTAVFPTLSRQSASAQTAELRNTVGRSLRAIIFLTLPGTVGIILLRRPIVALLFDHGHWTAASSAATEFALVFYPLSIAPYALIEVVARTFYALKNTLTPVVIAVIAALIDTILSVILIHMFSRSEGQGGLGIATAIAVWIQVLWLMRALNRQVPGLLDARFWASALGSAAASAGMGVCVYLALKALDGVVRTGSMGALVEVTGGVAAGLISYLVLARVFRLAEARGIMALADRFVSRPPRGRIP